jgi:hypothetical protein
MILTYLNVPISVSICGIHLYTRNLHPLKLSTQAPDLIAGSSDYDGQPVASTE